MSFSTEGNGNLLKSLRGSSQSSVHMLKLNQMLTHLLCSKVLQMLEKEQARVLSKPNLSVFYFEVFY